MSYQNTFLAIKKLIKNEKLTECVDATLTIEERAKQATLKKLEVVSVGTTAFFIKLDECGFPGQIAFNPHHSLHRACDALAFCDLEGTPYIVCCELKSSEPSRSEVVEQFESAHCFLEYLNILLNQYCGGLSITTWERRYFVFHSGPKTPLKQSSFRVHRENNTPQQALFISVLNGEKIYLRNLLGMPL